MSCSGVHCAGCGGGAVVPVIALVALEGFTWVAAHLIEVAAVSVTCAVLSVAAVVALMRWTDRRDARRLAAGPLMVTRADPVRVVTGRVITQVTGETRPAIEPPRFRSVPARHEAVRAIRPALPGAPAITEE